MPFTGTPMRGFPSTRGSDSGLVAASFESASRESAAGSMSGMTFDRSRSLPDESIMPGFSCPGVP
jgi:hypothetical protein